MADALIGAWTFINAKSRLTPSGKIIFPVRATGSGGGSILVLLPFFLQLVEVTRNAMHKKVNFKTKEFATAHAASARLLIFMAGNLKVIEKWHSKENGAKNFV